MGNGEREFFVDLVFGRRIVARLPVDEPPRVGELLWLAPGSSWRVVGLTPGGAVVRPESRGIQRFEENHGSLPKYR